MCVFLFILRTLSYSETEKRIIELTDEIQKLSSDVQQLHSLLLSGIPGNGVYQKIGQPHYYMLKDSHIYKQSQQQKTNMRSFTARTVGAYPFSPRGNGTIFYNYQAPQREKIMQRFQFKPYVFSNNSGFNPTHTLL